jgi:hypothetical protein
MVNKRFAVTFQLASAILMDKGINLAGMLAKRLADRGEADPLASVPLRNIDGIFAGSDLFVIGTPHKWHVAYVRSLRPAAMPHDLALRNPKGALLSQILLKQEYKNLLDTRTATTAPMVVAFGEGDIDRVRDLLHDVPAIGAKRSAGFGMIASVDVLRINHPHAGLADRAGNPLRSVPASIWTQQNLPPRPIRFRVARLPTWNSPQEPCVAPIQWEMEPDIFEQEVGA